MSAQKQYAVMITPAPERWHGDGYVVAMDFKTQTWKPERVLNLRHIRTFDERRIVDGIRRYETRHAHSPDRIRISQALRHDFKRVRGEFPKHLLGFKVTL